MSTYANFDLRLAGEPGAYTAEVLDAPAGQTSGPQPLADALPALPGVATPGDWEAIGRALWGAAFAGQSADLWRASLTAAGAGLRLRLALDAPELAGLPWELLYDDVSGRFLALDPGTPVVRFTRLPCAAVAWPQGRPLRLLFTGASPQGMLPLKVADEAAAVAAALVEPMRAGRLVQTALPTGATLPGLLAALVHPAGVDIWHFAGHGGQAGLFFDDGEGQAAAADAATVGLLLAGEGVRLAVLNACRTGQGSGPAASVAGALVRAGIPAVIAMQGDLSDAAAAALAQGLYAALAAGQPVDRALTAGRKAILALGGGAGADWWLPALFMRAPDGVLWQEEGAMDEDTARPGGSKAVRGAEIHTTGPVASGGSAISTGRGVAFVGNGNTVITGKVGGNVLVGSQPARAGGGPAEFLALLAQIRQQLTALAAPSDRAEAAAELAKAAELAQRATPPGGRIIRALENVSEILVSGGAAWLDELVVRAIQMAQGLWR